MTSLPSRSEFAARVATIKPGASREDVERVLGRPDDVRTEHDPGGITAARTVEIWRYGARAHLAFATLATVHLQADGSVQYVFGGTGTPPDGSLGLAEPELRRLLELVAAVPSYNAPGDPLALIRATNALQLLGKDRALAVIDEMLRVSSWLDDPGREGVFLLARTLFDAPATPPVPVMAVGAPDLDRPADAALFPRWPIVFAGDIPLGVVGGYALGGHPEPPEHHLDWFRKHGTIRAAPLAPVADPLDAIHAFVEGPLAAGVRVDEHLRVRLYDQALRLMQTVSRPASTTDGYFTHGADVPGRWKVARAAMTRLAPRWDAVGQHYVRADGTALAAPPPAPPRVWWETGLAGAAKARLTLERSDDHTVQIELRIELARGARLDAAHVRLVDPATDAVLSDLAVAPLTPPSSTSTVVSGTRLALPAGRTVRTELVQAGTTTRGPDLTP